MFHGSSSLNRHIHNLILKPTKMLLSSLTSRYLHQQRCQQIAMFFLLSAMFCTTLVSCSHPDTSYSTNCASLVPESKPRDLQYSNSPFPPSQDGFYLGGDGLLNHPNASQFYYFSSRNRKTFLFHTHYVHATDADDVFKVQASLVLQPEGMYYTYDLEYSHSYSAEVLVDGTVKGYLSFEVEGFWSKSTGNLCMVGFSSRKSPEGTSRNLAAVLKLYGITNQGNIHSLARGTLDSLSSNDDSSHFESLSLLMFLKKDYNYVDFSKDSGHGCSGEPNKTKGSYLSLPLTRSICSILLRSYDSFELQYASGCNSTQTCSPFKEGGEFALRFMSLNFIQCSADRQSLRFFLEFSDDGYSSYNRALAPNRILVAEGSWDKEENRLCVIACRVLNSTNSLNSSRVEDCSIRLSLRFPSVWWIGHNEALVGEIWSIKQSQEQEYFDRITFRSSRSEAYDILGLKYNYTKIDRARKSCTKKTDAKNRLQYPDGYSRDMQFDLSVKNSSRIRIGYGRADPIFLGDRPGYRYSLIASTSDGRKKKKSPVQRERGSQLNVSYEIQLPSFNASSGMYASVYWKSSGVQIFAEGIYDSETGEMCMVGCRYLDENYLVSGNVSMDCEILIKLHFPPMDSNKHIEGSIESKRKISDRLYFKSLTFTAYSVYGRFREESIWRMDFEIIMALIFNTLLCIFLVYQIFYAKKHPHKSLSISLVMLAVLALGQMIPLVLNFEALFFTNGRTFLRSSGRWLEANEVLVRFMTMFAFLLQIRLLQTVMSVRTADGNHKASSWSVEKKTLFVSLLLYIIGGLIAVLLNWKNYKFSDDQNGIGSVSGLEQSLWTDLRTYAGVIMDGFLFPQILFNIFQDSTEVALSGLFYIGTTFVRLLPHAYDLYRAHFYDGGDDFNWSYMYANHSADYYSTAWDVMIPAVGLFFAAILYLQQRHGGRFFLPNRFKDLQRYAKVPVSEA